MQVSTKANLSAAWALGVLFVSLGTLCARTLLAMRRARLRQELWRIDRADRLCASAPYRSEEEQAEPDA